LNIIEYKDNKKKTIIASNKMSVSVTSKHFVDLPSKIISAFVLLLAVC
jgi:hypothetical protein